MSTKIYDGFLIDTGNPLANFKFLNEVKSGVQELVQKKHHKLLALRLARTADLYIAHKRKGKPVDEENKLWADENNSLWWSVVHAVVDEQRECRSSLSRNPTVDCDVELFLRVHPETGAIYGYLQEERVGTLNYLTSLKGCRSYGYWNNTDQPEDVTEQEWEQRKDNWNRVLDDDVACLTLRWEPSFVMERDAVYNLLPSFGARVEAMATDEITALAANEILANEPSTEKLSQVMRAYRKAEDLLKQPENPWAQKLQALKEELSKILLPDLMLHASSSYHELLCLSEQQTASAA